MSAIPADGLVWVPALCLGLLAATALTVHRLSRADASWVRPPR